MENITTESCNIGDEDVVAIVQQMNNGIRRFNNEEIKQTCTYDILVQFLLKMF